MPSYISARASGACEPISAPTPRTTARAIARPTRGQPKACIRLTRCISMTLRERISGLLSERRGSGSGGAVDDVVLQGDGGDLQAGCPCPLGAARLGMHRGRGQRADLLEVEHVRPGDEALDLLEPAGDLDRGALQRICLVGDRHSALVQQHHVLEQVGDLVEDRKSTRLNSVTWPSRM